MPWVVAVGHGLCHAREGLCPKAWKGSHAAHKEEWAPLFIAYNTEWYWQLLLTDNVKEGFFFSTEDILQPTSSDYLPYLFPWISS